MVLNGGRCLDCGPTCPRWAQCGAIGEHLGPDTGSLETYQTFDEVLESVDKQFEYWTDQMCSSLCIIDNAHRALKPLPYVSAFYEDCLESGKDLTEGGAKYNGDVYKRQGEQRQRLKALLPAAVFGINLAFESKERLPLQLKFLFQPGLFLCIIPLIH